jgi:hypothetical protein
MNNEKETESEQKEVPMENHAKSNESQEVRYYAGISIGEP